MSAALLLACIALTLVFAIAAIGKLSDLDGARQTMEQFGLPRRTARPAAWVLSIAELVVAVGLLFVATAWAAAVAATLLLSLFCIAIVSVMARGEAPECNCFGSLGSTRVGLGTLVRNGVLLSVAGFVVVAGREGAGTSAFAWAETSPALAGIALLATLAMAAQAAFSWQLFKQNGRLLARVSALEGLSISDGSDDPVQIGLPAPAFALPDLDGRTLTFDDVLSRGAGALLFFTDPGCGHCETLLPAVAAAQAHDSSLPIVVISRGEVEPNRTRAAQHGLGRVMLQANYEVAEQYGIGGMPGAVLVDPEGLLASESVEGSDDVGELLEALFPPKASMLDAFFAPPSLYREVVAQ